MEKTLNERSTLTDGFWHAVQRLRARAASLASPIAARAGKPSDGVDDRVVGVDASDALVRLDAIRDDCRRLVTRRASMSAGAAVIPLPGLDLGTDIAILLKLLPQINERFGLSPAQIDGLDAETKRIVMVFVSSVGSGMVGRLVTRELVLRLLMKMGVRVTTKGMVKFVPLLGQAVSASISFGAMKLLGNRHIDDCYRVARETLLKQTSQGSAGSEWQVVP